MFDVAGLVPEARSVAQAVAEIYWRHTQPWFVGLVCFGSAVRGGVMPGVSDIDFHLYLKPSIFVEADGEQNVLPLELGLNIHRDLARLDPAPLRYIDGGVETGFIPEGHVGPIPGNYHLLAGKLPVPEATGEQLKDLARQELARLKPLPPFVSDALLQHGTGRGELSLTVRAFCQTVWPVIYHVACFLQNDALQVWQFPKERLIRLLPSEQAVGQSAQEFDTALRRYYPREAPVEDALAVIATGVRFLETVSTWVPEAPVTDEG